MMMKDTSDRAGSSINSKTTSPPAAMPRFYDSDTEEGAGSLGTFLDVCVFVGLEFVGLWKLKLQVLEVQAQMEEEKEGELGIAVDPLVYATTATARANAAVALQVVRAKEGDCGVEGVFYTTINCLLHYIYIDLLN